MINRLNQPFTLISFFLTVVFLLLSAKPIKQLTVIRCILIFFGIIKWMELCLEKKEKPYTTKCNKSVLALLYQRKFFNTNKNTRKREKG